MGKVTGFEEVARTYHELFYRELLDHAEVCLSKKTYKPVHQR